MNATRRTLRLRPEALEQWSSVREAAKACHLSTSTLSRCVAGEMAPGPFVVAALITTTGKPFAALFEVVKA